MKVAVVGANGLLGFQVARAALAAGLDVVPVVRDDRHQERISPLFLEGGIRYAPFHEPRAMAAALDGVDRVVGCLDPRGQGPGEPWAANDSAAVLVRVAREKSMEKLIMVSVVGNYRWSFFRLNRRAWRLDKGMRLEEGPWGLVRVSAYHDEILDGHVRPPDGRSPRPIPPKGQYSPVSRAEAGRLVVGALLHLPPGRAMAIGGPRIYTASELARAISPFVREGRGGRTSFMGLPKGDVAVQPDETRNAAGFYPVETLESFLEGRAPRPEAESILAPPPTSTPGFYPRGEPGPSRYDLGGQPEVLRPWGDTLRRVVHEALARDCVARGIPVDRIDFTTARSGARSVDVHGGTFTELSGVAVLDAKGAVVLRGDVTFVRDELAEVFEVFFGPDLPSHVWDALDLGVRRRLPADPRWKGDPRVR